MDNKNYDKKLYTECYRCRGQKTVRYCNTCGIREDCGKFGCKCSIFSRSIENKPCVGCDAGGGQTEYVKISYVEEMWYLPVKEKNIHDSRLRKDYNYKGMPKYRKKGFIKCEKCKGKKKAYNCNSGPYVCTGDGYDCKHVKDGWKSIWGECNKCRGEGGILIVEKLEVEVVKRESGDTTGCFITTATMLSLEKDDNCKELEIFRRFRDTWLLKNKPKDIKDYYLIAPLIVSEIDLSTKSKEIYHNIWTIYLERCYSLLLKDESDSAYKLYRQMVIDLKITFLSN